MSDFFRAYRADGTKIPAYFIESTAPDNVDDQDRLREKPPAGLKPIDPDQAIDEIAGELAKGDHPNLVVMVHGFNNPEPAVLKMYKGAFDAVQADTEIPARPGLVFIGYRWPSERMGTLFRGSWAALPDFPRWILYLGIIIIAVSYALFRRYGGGMYSVLGYHVATLLGWTLAGLVLTAVLLRAIVYFRDTYRATNYGVPDLVHILRVINAKMVAMRGSAAAADARRVDLSFIAHSMGGLVATNTIRVLSNAFGRQVQSVEAFGAAGFTGLLPPEERQLGDAFRLRRFVLASPDVPAEALLTNRANFLASALLRFDEAYLFCSEGDEVLRQISTLANYFVFPTKKRDHSFRLGNVEILSRNVGIIKVRDVDFLGALRVGRLTLQQLYEHLEDAEVARHGTAHALGAPPLPGSGRLPRVFTYFDCTDYVGPDRQGMTRPLLTFAKWGKRHDAKARLSWYSHLHLLLAYVARHQRPNVHGGYFEGELSQQLMYRLICLGYDGTKQAFGSEAAMSAACAAQQIRVLVSPLLAGRTEAAMAPGVVHVAPAPTVTGLRGLTMPDVEHKPIEEARRIIDSVRAGLVAATPTAVPGRRPHLVLLEVTEQSEQPAGTVLRQTPMPGTPLVAGTPIEVVVVRK